MSKASKQKRDEKNYVDVKRRLAEVVRVCANQRGTLAVRKIQLQKAARRIAILEAKVGYLDGCLRRKSLWRRAGRWAAKAWRAGAGKCEPSMQFGGKAEA